MVATEVLKPSGADLRPYAEQETEAPVHVKWTLPDQSWQLRRMACTRGDDAEKYLDA